MAAILVAPWAGARQVSPIQTPPTFRSAAGYVRVSAVVTDKDDRPVPTLTKDDFEIEEDGRPQTIAECYFISIPVEPRARTPHTFNDVFQSDTSPNARRFVILIDDLHIVESSIAAVKRITSEFLNRLASDDEVAVVFVSRSDLSQDFTSDRERLEAGFGRLREALGFGLDASPRQRFASSYRRATVSVLRNVTAVLSTSNTSRRAIVYIGNGPDTKLPEDDELADTLAMAKRLDVPIYTVDPRGLVIADDAVRGGIGAFDGPAARTTVQGTIRRQHNVLAEIAINTGGRAFINRASPADAATEILTENGAFYLLSYSPDPFLQDGKFHGIEVRVKRPGLRIRARAGYTSPAFRNTTASDSERQLGALLAAGANPNTWSVRAVATPLEWTPKAIATMVTVEPIVLDPVDLSHPVAMRILALDPDGKITADLTRRFAALADDARPKPRHLNAVIELPKKTRTVRVGVADLVNGNMASVGIPITVLEPGGADIELSGVAIGASDVPNQGRRLEDETLGHLVPFQPTARRQFSRAETIEVFVNVFWKGGSGVHPNAVLEIKGTARSTSDSVIIQRRESTGTFASGSIHLTKSLSDVPAGRYMLEVIVKSANGHIVSRTISFLVLGE